MIAPYDDGWSWYVHGVQLYAALIRTRTPFAQANYGDGEWGCILGRRLTNSQGEVYCDELEEALQQTLLEPAGQWCGTNPGRKMRAEAEAWVEANGVDVPWVYKDTLSAANVNGRLGPLFRACRQREVTLVGPAHLSELGEDVVGPFDHVEVPDAVAWMHADEVVDALRWSSLDLVLCAAGMATNLIVHGLWSRRDPSCVNPRPVTVLDIGACLDPYVGVYSRKGYRTDTFQQDAMARNLA